jgi:hypothetical protein
VVGVEHYRLSNNAIFARIYIEDANKKVFSSDVAPMIYDFKPVDSATDVPRYKDWYVEAMIASNEAGYAGVSAADTIRFLDERLQDILSRGEDLRFT